MLKSFVICDEDGLQEIVNYLLPLVKPGMTIGLTGPLGAGKSTLVRQLLARWTHQGDVPSPTFVLSISYSLPIATVEHWDLYRLRGIPPELEEPPDANVIRLVEWPERAGEALRLDMDIIISFTPGQEKARMVCIR